MKNENITSTKILAHLDRISGDFRPITADIFLNNYCNCNCSYCTYKRWEFDEGSKAMTFEEFVKYAERLLQLGVKGFILSGGGEPLLIPDFDKITAWLDERNIEYGINTNFGVLKYCKPQYLKVSLDGYSEKTYSALRGVNIYKRVIQNIKTFAEWKKNNSPQTSLGIQMLVKKAKDVRRFYNEHKNLEVDYIVFRPVESTDGQYYADKHNDVERKKIIKAVKELQKKDNRVSLNFKWNLTDKKFNVCTASWAQIAINQNGEVMYCCHKPYEIVGHILDDDILEKKRKFATNMAMCDIPCRMTAPNMTVDTLRTSQKNKNFI